MHVNVAQRLSWRHGTAEVRIQQVSHRDQSMFKTIHIFTHYRADNPDSTICIQMDDIVFIA